MGSLAKAVLLVAILCLVFATCFDAIRKALGDPAKPLPVPSKLYGPCQRVFLLRSCECLRPPLPPTLGKSKAAPLVGFMMEQIVFSNFVANYIELN